LKATLRGKKFLPAREFPSARSLLTQRDNVAELDEKSLDSNKIFQQRVADKENEIKKIDKWLHSMFRYNRKEI
jgi:hypothetical protein